jgi:hypothetical protein
VAKAVGKRMTLRKIRGVRPAQMRQMYMAAVVPTTDYEALTWYTPSRNEAKRHVVAIERVQRLASTLILRTYKWVAMLVLQSEAKLQSVTDRLRERVFQHLIKLSLLTTDHPLQGYISWFPLRGSAGSSLRRTVYEMYEGQLEPENRLADHPTTIMGDAAITDPQEVSRTLGAGAAVQVNRLTLRKNKPRNYAYRDADLPAALNTSL